VTAVASSTPSDSALTRAVASRAPLSRDVRDALCRLDDAQRLGELLDAADALRLRGVVLARLVREPRLALSPDTRRAIDAALHAERRRVAAQDMERERVLALLRRAGVPAVLLKGSALRLVAYHDPAERPAGDIDLLVPADLIEDALAALAAGGYAMPTAGDRATYVRHHFHHRLEHPGGQVVEMHWALTEPEAPVRLDAAAFLRGATTLARRTAASVLVPRPEHLVLHLAAQNAVDPRRLIGRCVDLDRISDSVGVDWARVVEDARRGGFSTATWLTLHTARALLGTPVPADVLGRLRPSRVVRAHLALLRPGAPPQGEPQPAARIERLRQLWILLGDHSLRVAVRWLATQGFVGPRLRARAEAESRWTRWRGQAADLLSLAAAQALLYLPRGSSGVSRS